MLIRDILEGTDAFPTIVTDATCEQAAQLMRDSNVRAIPVVENDRLVGIVTDWDIVDSFASRAEDLGTLPVSSIMTKDGLLTVRDDATAADATTLLAEHRVHHLPVLTAEGAYRGMICLGLEWSETEMLTPPVRPTLTARHP